MSECSNSRPTPLDLLLHPADHPILNLLALQLAHQLSHSLVRMHPLDSLFARQARPRPLLPTQLSPHQLILLSTLCKHFLCLLQFEIGLPQRPIEQEKGFISVFLCLGREKLPVFFLELGALPLEVLDLCL